MDVYDKFLKSEATRKTYLHYFNRFLKWLRENGNDFIISDKLLELDNKAVPLYVEDYIPNLRKFAFHHGNRSKRDPLSISFP